MIIIYFKGERLSPDNLMKDAFFSQLNPLHEKGKPSKIGFKNKMDFNINFAKLVVEDKYNNNIDLILFEITRSLKSRRRVLIESFVDEITLLISSKSTETIDFAINKRLLNISPKIAFEIKFEFKVPEEIENPISSITSIDKDDYKLILITTSGKSIPKSVLTEISQKLFIDDLKVESNKKVIKR